jgi:hypothetical protein
VTANSSPAKATTPGLRAPVGFGEERDEEERSVTEIINLEKL